MRLIDKTVLARYIEFRGFSYAGLAGRVGCSKATIGHLCTGHTKSIRSAETAKAIERELNVPPGSLFVPNVFRVSENAA